MENTSKAFKSFLFPFKPKFRLFPQLNWQAAAESGWLARAGRKSGEVQADQIHWSSSRSWLCKKSDCRRKIRKFNFPNISFDAKFPIKYLNMLCCGKTDWLMKKPFHLHETLAVASPLPAPPLSGRLSSISNTLTMIVNMAAAKLHGGNITKYILATCSSSSTQAWWQEIYRFFIDHELLRIRSSTIYNFIFETQLCGRDAAKNRGLKAEPFKWPLAVWLQMNFLDIYNFGCSQLRKYCSELVIKLIKIGAITTSVGLLKLIMISWTFGAFISGKIDSVFCSLENNLIQRIV